MVIGTWIFSFGCLISTWLEKWGKFGLDLHIGSCSILPDTNGSSPKEFLFIMAFALPILALILCYARIFYIVRKTAFKLQDNQIKADSSIRIPNNHPPVIIKNHGNGKTLRKLSTENDDSNKETPSPSTESNISMQGLMKEDKKKFLSKTKDEDLKFIDTSVESDLPPTLSQLQRKSVKLLIDDKYLADSQDNSTIIQLEIERLNDKGSQRDNVKGDVPMDSAVESITNSLDMVHQIKH